MKKIYKIEELMWIIVISVIIYLLIPPLILYLLPINKDVCSKVCVLLINTIYVFISCMKYTKKNSFKWYYPILLGMTFIPCSLLIYNFDTIYYSVYYIVIGLISSLICYRYIKL